MLFPKEKTKGAKITLWKNLATTFLQNHVSEFWRPRVTDSILAPVLSGKNSGQLKTESKWSEPKTDKFYRNPRYKQRQKQSVLTPSQN